MTGEPVVTGIGVVGAWGDSPAGGRAAVALPDTPAEPGWFDTAARLGRRGFKYLPPACRYLLAAGRAAVADADGLAWVAPERRAGAIGTNTAVRASLAEADAAVTEGRVADLGPAAAPFFAVSAVGTRLSIEHGLKGFTLTLTSPVIAGIEALHLGRRAMTAHGCAALLVAATEDVPGARAGQGAAVLVLEDRAGTGCRGAPAAYGSCRSRVLFLPPRLLAMAEGRARAVRLVGRALAELDRERAFPIHQVVDGSPVAAVIAEAVGDTAAVTPRSGALAPMLVVAGLLAGGRPGVVVAGTGEGTVALVRVCPAGAPRVRGEETG
ncbi:hypothetical protein [Amycolatopsis samaneae]|uniref:Beta-ketoacyl synthase N-terminal domain-containing protein n=1 Tax=Amycolatopsis samaneae TaxID=664691 RepID=A0ABW5GP77_9PSEU